MGVSIRIILCRLHKVKNSRSVEAVGRLRSSASRHVFLTLSSPCVVAITRYSKSGANDLPLKILPLPLRRGSQAMEELKAKMNGAMRRKTLHKEKAFASTLCDSHTGGCCDPPCQIRCTTENNFSQRRDSSSLIRAKGRARRSDERAADLRDWPTDQQKSKRR